MSVARITLDSPETRNALSPELVGRLRERLGAAHDDPEVRVVLLDQEGPAFCAGADLKSASHDPGEFIALLRELWYSPKPVVAHVAGAARGGGMGLVAACDIVVASEDATFGFPEVRIGAAPAIVSALVLQRVRRGDALELFLTGKPVGAERARELGLVTAIGDPQPYVDALLKGGPNALAVAKRLVNEPAGLDDLERLGELSSQLFAGEELKEGVAAFLEQRPARW